MTDQIQDNTDNSPLTVVGIGASAGGLAALSAFFKALPTDTGLAFVVVQHLAPTKKSELDAILQRYTEMPVDAISESARLKPDHIYVLPPNHSLTIEDETLHLVTPDAEVHEHLSIDRFFESLALAKKEHAIGIVLSGTRSDGARGVSAIKEQGGLTLVQSPEDAEFESMPRAAIDTRQVDLVLPADELGKRLASFAASGNKFVVETYESDDLDDADSVLQRILSRVYAVTGHDFSKYKRSTILRRIGRRVGLHQVADLRAYLEILDEDAEEAQILFNEFLLTVTEFFRDPEAFAALEKKVIPQLYKQQKPEETIRVWIPGCASGEEVYSIAMLLWEEAQRREVFPDFKIFATDLSSRAIAQARKGVYSTASLATLSSQRRERFFTSDPGGMRVTGELRDRVLFAIHDVLRDPPFARQDFISCRNLLIYLDPKGQQQVFEVFHYALRSQGFLFLGNSEFLGDADELFADVDPSNRIYSPKHVRRNIRPNSQIAGSPIRSFESPDEQSPRTLEKPGRIKHIHHQLLSQEYAPPGVIVDSEHRILHISGDVTGLLRIPSGEPTADILRKVCPEFRLPLRTALIDVFEEEKSTRTAAFTVERHGGTTSVCLYVRLLPGRYRDEHPLAQIVFETTDEPTPSLAKLPADLTEADASVHRAVEQLEAENDRLKTSLHDTIDRYEATTEQLKTSNEELLTINEELQSTSEELETSTEELQSTNEELTIVNDELSNKINQLDQANSDLENLLSSTEIGTLFLNCDLEIRRFTSPICDFFNLRESDLERPLAHITHSLEYDNLLEDTKSVLHNLKTIEREIRSEEERWYIARIFPYETVQNRIDGVVITFFDITHRKKAQQQLVERELLFRTVFERATDELFLFHLDADNRPSTFTEVNAGACDDLGYSEQELLDMTLADLVDPTSIDIAHYLHTLSDTGEAVAEVRFLKHSGEPIDEAMVSRIFTISGEPTVITVSRDITRRKAHEEALMEARDESHRLAELRASFVANMSHEIRTPLTSIIGVSQLLQDKQLSASQKKMVSLIQTSGRRLQQTLDSVLDISRIEAGEMLPRYREIDVVAQIKEDVELLRPLADRKNLDLKFDSPHPAFSFVSDAGFLNRIVYNLTENAIKFTDDGEVRVRLQPGDEEFKLIVSDTGIGISEEFLPHLFEKFKQASIGNARSYDGSGLGMALVQNLVSLLDGTIEIESTRGEGTTFIVTIPLHEADE